MSLAASEYLSGEFKGLLDRRVKAKPTEDYQQVIYKLTDVVKDLNVLVGESATQRILLSMAEANQR